MFWDILSHNEFIGQKLNLFYEYLGIYVPIHNRQVYKTLLNSLSRHLHYYYYIQNTSF